MALASTLALGFSLGCTHDLSGLRAASDGGAADGALDADASSGDGGGGVDGGRDDAGSCPGGLFSGVAPGGRHTCARRRDGSVICFGANDEGQLGAGHHGAVEDLATLTDLEGTYTQVVSGRDHSCGIRDDGSLWCWGGDGRGELGPRAGAMPSRPARVEGLDDVVGACAGDSFTCVVRGAERAVHCWGDNSEGQTGDPVAALTPTPFSTEVRDAVSLTCGQDHACAVLVTGELVCWGDGDDGQLGSAVTESSTTPVAAGLVNVEVAVAGFDFTCATTREPGADARLHCWGRGGAGQLGNGAFVDSAVPVSVPLPSSPHGLAAGHAYACAALDDGTVHCWGANGAAERGVADPSAVGSPAPVPGVASATDVVAGRGSRHAHTCAMLSDETFVCWGHRSYGQLGDGPALVRDTPSRVLGITEATGLWAGGHQSCAQVAAGVLCWGGNASGELGDGSTITRSHPEAIAAMRGYASIGLGGDHSAGVDEAGQLYAWGWNGAGQLGTGGLASGSTRPGRVGGATNWAEVSAGLDHTCATSATGRISCWGQNTSGELGVGSYDVVVTPTTVDTTNVAFSSLSVGDHFGCALRGVAAWCWGDSSDGQVGYGGVETQLSPVRAMATALVRVEVGARHACALDDAGGVLCWGDDGEAQVGGVGGEALVPQAVALPQPATDLALGDHHSCALTAEGVYCWGEPSTVSSVAAALASRTARLSSSTPRSSVSPPRSPAAGITYALSTRPAKSGAGARPPSGASATVSQS